MTNRKVLLPYKITLLSNLLVALRQLIRVLLPYKITLLSNSIKWKEISYTVLLPYKITLLSNRPLAAWGGGGFYYPIKLHYSQTLCAMVCG